MVYTPQSWANSPATSSPLSAARMQHIEDGIKDASDRLDAAEGAVDNLEAKTLADYVDTTGAAVGGVYALHQPTSGEFALTPALPQRALLRPGRRWAYIGDSMTNGSNASNSVYAFPSLSRALAGTLFAPDPVATVAGVAGERSDQILARVDTVLNGGAHGLVVLAGANDAAQGVTLATFRTNMAAIIAKARVRNVPVVVCTPPPEHSTATNVAVARPLLAQYNAWLRMVAPSLGAELADTAAAIADPTTGDMATGYNSDGIHMNDLGHSKMAQAVAAAMLRATGQRSATGMVTVKEPTNLVNNPLIGTAPAAGVPANTYAGPISGATATHSVVADTFGVLPAGYWAKVALDASGGASTAYRAFTLSSGVVASGNTIAVTGHIVIEVTAGDWEAAVAAGTARAVAGIRQGATEYLMATQGRAPGRKIGTGLYLLGPFLQTRTKNASNLDDVLYGLTLPSGLVANAYFGCIGVYDLTALGLADLLT